MTVSRNQFDETKNWTEPEWQEGVPVMDADLNLAVKIGKTGLRRAVCDFLGNGSPNDGFKLSGLVTDPAIHAGAIWVAGLRIGLPEDIQGSAQPNAPVSFPIGDGIWFLDAVEQLLTNADDPAIRDYRLPANVETPVKVWKADWTLRKAPGASLPAPEPNHYHIGIALETGGVLTDIRNEGMILAGADTGYQSSAGDRPGSGHRHKDEDIDVENPNYTGDTLDEVLDEIDSRIGVVEGDVGVVTSHAASHGAGGSDPVNIANLPGQCTQAQVSPAHSGLHTATFNGLLPIAPDVNGNASIGAHLADAAIHRKNHNDLLSMQGGTPTERYHLALDLYNAATGAAGANASNPFATVGDLSGVASKFAAPVQTIQELRDIPAADRSDRQVRLVEDKGALYRFDETGAGADDGDGVIAPSSGAGRWFKMSSAVPDLSTVLAKGNSAGNRKIVNLFNPENNQDAATKYYVDAKFGAAGQAAMAVMDAAGLPGTFTGLQAAVDALGPDGGIIWVKPGTYNISATVTMKPNVKVSGMGAIAERLQHPGARFIPAPGFHGVMMQAYPGNSFENITIQVPENGVGISPYRQYGSRLDVEGCVFEGVPEYGQTGSRTIGIGGDYGLYGAEITSGIIRHNVFRRLTHAIYAEINNDSYIEGNVFFDGTVTLPLSVCGWGDVTSGGTSISLLDTFLDAGEIVVGDSITLTDGTHTETHRVTAINEITGPYRQVVIDGAWAHDYVFENTDLGKPAAQADITCGDNTYETFILNNFFNGSDNGRRIFIHGSGVETGIGFLSGTITGNVSTGAKPAGASEPAAVKLEISPYSFGSDIVIANNAFDGLLKVLDAGAGTLLPVQCAGNVFGAVDMTGFTGRVAFNSNLVQGGVSLKNAASVNGNYVTGSLEVVSGATERTLATGNFVGNGMTLAGDYSAAVGNVIENGGLNAAGEGARASSNSIRGTLALGFWGAATGNVIRTSKQVAISAVVPRAQIIGNACLDEFSIHSTTDNIRFTASGISCAFADASDADSFQPGCCVTFQSSKDMETRMITGKSANIISWTDPLNSSYGGSSNQAWAYTNLAHIDGVSSLSIVNGNFVCGDINVIGGTNLSCSFAGSSCVVSGNRVLGMVVTTAAAKKNVVTGNIFSNSKAVQPGFPKVYPFTGNPDNSNEIAHNIINGSVL